MLDQYMQRIDDLDRIIQPVAARTQVQHASYDPPHQQHVHERCYQESYAS